MDSLSNFLSVLYSILTASQGPRLKI